MVSLRAIRNYLSRESAELHKPKPAEHKPRRQRRNLEELYPDDYCIFLLCKSNPKRENTDAWFRFEKYYSSTTVEEAVSAGVARRHIDEDVYRGYLSVEKPADTSDVG